MSVRHTGRWGGDPGERLVREVMHRDFIRIDPDESLLAAERTMRLARIRHLPVVRDGTLLGILSYRDLLVATLGSLESDPGPQAFLRETPAEKLMSQAVATVTPYTPLRSAALTMLRHGVGCLPVEEREEGHAELVGLLTESDLLRAAYVPELSSS